MHLILISICFALNNLPIGQSAFQSVANCPKEHVCQSLAEWKATKQQNDKITKLCYTNDQALGICSTSIENVYPGSRSPIKLPKNFAKLQAIKITEEETQSVLDTATSESKKEKEKIDLIQDLEVQAPSKSREKEYQKNLGTSKMSETEKDQATFALQVSKALAKKLKLSSPEQVASLEHFALLNVIEPEMCHINITCNPDAKYRSIDGSCNNLDHPEWGKSSTPYARVLLPQYGDGVDSPKVAKSGNPLPLARRVSTTITADKPRNNSNLTTLFLAYGQWLDHDFSQVIGETLPNGEAITCCDQIFKTATKLLHPACFPIEVPADDSFYSQYGVKCLNFVRTAIGLPADCKLGPRNQVNTLTPWIDGSIIYGYDSQRESGLRSFENGELAAEFTAAGEILFPETDMCNNNTHCLHGGDTRANQQPGLMATHIVWARFHNNIARELRSLHPTWNDEELFQEARRIIVAVMQHITYNEYLVNVVGEQNLKYYGLDSQTTGYNKLYDPKINPAMILDVVSAGFRQHTVITNMVELRDDKLQVIRETPLVKLYYNPSVFHEPSAYEPVLNGLLGQTTCPADNILTEAITNHLFEPGTHGHDLPWGFDIFSIDVQRGRDHALAGYNDWREVCGSGRISNFSQLEGQVFPDCLIGIEELYEDPDDIDLVVGLNCEYRQKGQVLGPTASCMTTEAFRRLKYADRFWYENEGQPSSFTPDQLEAIRKISYARVLCDNSNIKYSQEKAFLAPSESNPRVSCENLSSPSLDISLWKDEIPGPFASK